MTDPPDATAGAVPDDPSTSRPGPVVRRAVIVARLAEDVVQICELYQVGLDIVTGGPAEAHKYLLAHTMREIRTRLPLHYGVASAGRFDWEAAVRKFSTDWVVEVRTPQLVEMTGTSATDAVTVSRGLAGDIDALVIGHGQVRDNVRDLYLRLNERVNPTTYPATATGGVIDQWLDLPLHRMAHMPSPESRPFSLAQCLDAWRTMEEYLFYVFAPATVTYTQLDSILEDANAS